MSPRSFNAANWYWVVAGSTAQVFSSAAGAYVPVGDAGYAAWLASGNAPSRIASEAELLDVLANVAAGVVAQFPAGLIAYAQQKQAAVAAGGITVNLGGVMVKASTDTASLILLQGANAKAAANSAAMFNWVQPTGVPVTLTVAQIAAIYDAVQDFLQATFTTLAAIIGGINANPPTITARGQVDAPPAPIAAWPANS